MTEIEKNKTVLSELFGDREFSEDLIENRLVDWDKAFTSIFYLKKSDAFKAKGENVYEPIRTNCSNYLAEFKKNIERLAKESV